MGSAALPPAMTTLATLKRATAPQLGGAIVAIAAIATLLGVGVEFFLLVLLASPVVAFFTWLFRTQGEHGISDREVEQLWVTFLGGIFPGAAIAGLAESLLLPLAAIVCFYDQRETLAPQLREFLATTTDRAADDDDQRGRLAEVVANLEIHKGVGYYAFLLLLSYVVAGLVEEWVKLWLVQGTCCLNCSAERRWLCDPRRLLFRRVNHPSHPRVIVLALTAAALGFSFAENVAYTFVLPTLDDRLLSAILRTIVSTPLHCLCGAITGTRLARVLISETTDSVGRWAIKIWALGPAIVVHGSFDLQIFLISSVVSEAASDAHPVLLGMLLPTLVTVVVLLVGAYVAKTEWRRLEEAVGIGGKGQYAHLAMEGDGEPGLDSEEEDNDDDDHTAQGRTTLNGVPRGAMLV